MLVKICGLRTPADVEAARAAGADAIGVVMSAKSPRNLSLSEAIPVVRASETMLSVLVVNDLSIAEAVANAKSLGVDVLQLHDYTEADTRRALDAVSQVWRATSISRGPTIVGAYGEQVLLLDSHTPGSGKPWDLSLLTDPPVGNWMLAGGLTPDNVAEAIRTVQPWGVDVSSGIESAPGVKDHELMRRFVTSARNSVL